MAGCGNGACCRKGATACGVITLRVTPGTEPGAGSDLRITGATGDILDMDCTVFVSELPPDAFLLLLLPLLLLSPVVVLSFNCLVFRAFDFAVVVPVFAVLDDPVLYTDIPEGTSPLHLCGVGTTFPNPGGIWP